MQHPEEELICYCFQISRQELIQWIGQHQWKTVEEVAAGCDACNGCRTCYIDIAELLAQYWQKEGQ